jgi:PPOX class probable F420-dependent enzyme
MHKTIMEEFKNQKYINVETFRKTGAAVQTPVWFVQEGDSLLVRTFADSGKMKRVRNNSRVRVAVCNMSGGLLGEWHNARAEVVQDQAVDQRVNKLLSEKYGMIKKLLDWREKNKETNYGIMRIVPDGIKDN